MHSYQHNIKTFNSATRHLTRVERSLYRDLIELYYDSEKPLPADNFDRLARLVLANSDDEKAALRYVLDEFFALSGDFYVHDYCDEQIEKFYANTTAKALAGKASAKARQEKQEQRKREREAQKQTAAQQNSTDVERNPANHEPVNSNHNKPVNNFKDTTPQAASGLFGNPDDSNTDNKKPPKPKAAEKFKPESMIDTMPPVLGEWWLKWIDYRRARKLSTKEPTWRLQAANLEEWGKAGLDPCQAIKASIENGWQGLFEPKPKNTGMSNGYQPRPANHIDDNNTDWINGIDPRVFDRARAGGTAAQQGSAGSEGHLSGLEGCDNQPGGLRLDAPAVAHRDAGKQDFD